MLSEEELCEWRDPDPLCIAEDVELLFGPQRCPWWVLPKRGRRHWHASGRGVALCRLAARRRGRAALRVHARGGHGHVGAAAGGAGGLSESPSEFARLFTSSLPLFCTALVLPRRAGSFSDVTAMKERLGELEAGIDALEDQLRSEEEENVEL